MTTAAPVTPYGCNFNKTMPFTNTSANLLLIASTPLSWTVPGIPEQRFRATFRASFTAEIYVSLNGTAALPTSGVATTTTNNQEFIPLLEPKYVKGGDVLSFVSAGTPSIGIQLHHIQSIT